MREQVNLKTVSTAAIWTMCHRTSVSIRARRARLQKVYRLTAGIRRALNWSATLQPYPPHALDGFTRLLKPGGKLILTAPFGSNVHMAPYHYCSGFSKYWYEFHLAQRGLSIEALTPNGDWYVLLLQEITRLGGLERQRGNWSWPLAYIYALLGLLYFNLRGNKSADDLACFGWQCVAVKQS